MFFKSYVADVPSELAELNAEEVFHVAGGPEVGNDPGQFMLYAKTGPIRAMPEEGNDPGH